jgi:hypothetical protein
MAIPKTPLRYCGDPSSPGQGKLPKAQPLCSQWQSTRACCRYPKHSRLRDKHHITWVSKCPCLIYGRQPSDPHHLRFAQPRAFARKVSDEFIVPLCRAHHHEVHRSSDEVGWWKQTGLDPLGLAQKLWRDTHPLQQSVAGKSDAL